MSNIFSDPLETGRMLGIAMAGIRALRAIDYVATMVEIQSMLRANRIKLRENAGEIFEKATAHWLSTRKSREDPHSIILLDRILSAHTYRIAAALVELAFQQDEDGVIQHHESINIQYADRWWMTVGLVLECIRRGRPIRMRDRSRPVRALLDTIVKNRIRGYRHFLAKTGEVGLLIHAAHIWPAGYSDSPNSSTQHPCFSLNAQQILATRRMARRTWLHAYLPKRERQLLSTRSCVSQVSTIRIHTPLDDYNHLFETTSDRHPHLLTRTCRIFTIEDEAPRPSFITDDWSLQSTRHGRPHDGKTANRLTSSISYQRSFANPEAKNEDRKSSAQWTSISDSSFMISEIIARVRSGKLHKRLINTKTRRPSPPYISRSILSSSLAGIINRNLIREASSLDLLIARRMKTVLQTVSTEPRCLSHEQLCSIAERIIWYPYKESVYVAESGHSPRSILEAIEISRQLALQGVCWCLSSDRGGFFEFNKKERVLVHIEGRLPDCDKRQIPSSEIVVSGLSTNAEDNLNALLAAGLAAFHSLAAKSLEMIEDTMGLADEHPITLMMNHFKLNDRIEDISISYKNKYSTQSQITNIRTMTQIRKAFIVLSKHPLRIRRLAERASALLLSDNFREPYQTNTN